MSIVPYMSVKAKRGSGGERRGEWGAGWRVEGAVGGLGGVGKLK